MQKTQIMQDDLSMYVVWVQFAGASMPLNAKD